MWRLFDRDSSVPEPDVASSVELIARGEYLARAADCMACHTQKGGSALSGGVPFNLPFGTIYSTNITSDRKTGIGTWSDDDFVRALHKGVSKDGHYLYPAFPYTSFSRLSRDDAVAIKAYLFSLPAVYALPRPSTLSFPFNQRWAMAFWNLIFLDDHRFKVRANLNAPQNRGAYLATALGHCAECHTPRTIAFSLDLSRSFSGAPIEGWNAYNITPDRQFGVGQWTDQQLADYLSTGHASGRGSATGPMGEVIANSLQYLTSQDISALVSYFRTVAPQPGHKLTRVEVSPTVNMLAALSDKVKSTGMDIDLGRRVFSSACAGCHMESGRGRQSGTVAVRRWAIM
ncbi:Gluconate 2-dehydrogenase (acceptor) [Burkholderia sp. BT03]|nr:Gluconate 2-dehydrogenase (acceptor) [Burkholderia sp. BT03]SKC52772.1 Cytochrome c, mono-and diheme variants [Paraburkholderia hospita]